jgi:hypothetical protein
MSIGANGCEYFEHEDDITWVSSRDMHYVDHYMAQNGIVYCEDTGEHEHRDDAVYLDQRDEWVSIDCTYQVFCESSATNEHIDDCVLLDDGTYILKNDHESEAAA